MNTAAAGRTPKGGTRGKRARLALKGPLRACCPMASFAYFPSLESRPSETSSSQAAYRSACRKRQASFTPLLVLSPRKAFRLPRGPRFRFAGLVRGPRAALRSPMNGRRLQVWAGNAARAKQLRRQTAEPASNCFQVWWVIELHRRRTRPRKGSGETGAFGPERALPPLCPRRLLGTFRR